MEDLKPDTFLIVRKIHGSSASEQNIEWAIVDTRNAAEDLRDVSDGPTPYFPLVTQEIVHPT